MRACAEQCVSLFFELGGGDAALQTVSQHVRSKQQSHRARGATALRSPTAGPGRGGATGARERGALAEQSEKV
jgi:hypothetical protein